MKILTAITHATEPDDFTFTEDGEIVVPNPLVCDNGPSCGCDRAAIGLITGRGTTTMQVSEMALTDDDIATLVTRYATSTGWLAATDVRELFDQAAKVANDFPMGTILRLRAAGDHVTFTSTATAGERP